MPTSPTRTLVVMRHARAEQTGPSDAERHLVPRGHEDAAAAGAWLAGRGVVPGAAIVSVATRTQETWEATAGAAGWSLEPRFERALYEADVDSALDLVRQVEDDLDVVVLLGHNPTVGSLAHLLDDGEGDVGAGNEMVTGSFPTCAVAVLEHRGPWSELAPGAARLSAFHVGRA